MPFKYGKKSRQRLDTCHSDLIVVFEIVLEHFDHSILCGHRNRQAQNKAFRDGKSKAMWPNSEHNDIPSNAADAAPYPIDWGERGNTKQRKAAIARFYYFAGYVLAVADRENIKLRWGGDWDMDRMFCDQTFNDLVHFERSS